MPVELRFEGGTGARRLLMPPADWPSEAAAFTARLGAEIRAMRRSFPQLNELERLEQVAANQTVNQPPTELQQARERWATRAQEAGLKREDGLDWTQAPVHQAEVLIAWLLSRGFERLESQVIEVGFAPLGSETGVELGAGEDPRVSRGDAARGDLDRLRVAGDMPDEPLPLPAGSSRNPEQEADAAQRPGVRATAGLLAQHAPEVSRYERILTGRSATLSGGLVTELEVRSDGPLPLRALIALCAPVGAPSPTQLAELGLIHLDGAAVRPADLDQSAGHEHVLEIGEAAQPSRTRVHWRPLKPSRPVDFLQLAPDGERLILQAPEGPGASLAALRVLGRELRALRLADPASQRLQGAALAKRVNQWLRGRNLAPKREISTGDIQLPMRADLLGPHATQPLPGRHAARVAALHCPAVESTQVNSWISRRGHEVLVRADRPLSAQALILMTPGEHAADLQREAALGHYWRVSRDGESQILPGELELDWPQGVALELRGQEKRRILFEVS